MPPFEGVVPLGLLFVWAAFGGLVARRLRMPPLQGMLLTGIGIRNLPGDLLEDLSDDWSIATMTLAAATFDGVLSTLSLIYADQSGVGVTGPLKPVQLDRRR